MGENSKVTRRNFVKLCASAMAAAAAHPQLLAQAAGHAKAYQRVRLITDSGRAVTPANLVIGENYLFHYPYVTTPCFLVNLGTATVLSATLKTEEGSPYEWKGGVGPNRSVVAFSAICAHKMTHPARAVSFINYRHNAVRFKDKEESTTARASIIYCCSEKSVYDPTDGARVLGGPALQPLATIGLEYDPRDGALYATGVYGGDMFEKFFTKFRERLELEYLTSHVRAQVSGVTKVIPLSEYCQTQVLC